jgi:tetratricopeptide (TPR) repeat protein
MFDRGTQTAVLDEAIAAAKSGDRIKAKDKLTRYLRYDQKNEHAWLWMSAVVDSDRERIFCLTNALKLNPNSKTVKRGLALLGALPAEMRGDLDIEVIGVDMKADAASSGVNGRSGKGAAKRGGFVIRRNRRLENLAIILLALVLVVGCLTVGLNLGQSQQAIASLLRITPPTSTPTRTPIPPTETRTPTPEPPTATVFAPTAPVAGINATPIGLVLGKDFTPTPAAVDIPFFAEEAFSHGQKSYEDGFYETALTDFQKAADDNKDNYAAHYYIGLIHLERKNYNAAFNAFGAALRISPNFAPAFLGRGQSTFGAGGNPVPDYNRAKAAAPNWVDPYVHTAIFYASRRNVDGAIAELETAQQLAPDNVVVLLNLAEQYIAVGRTEDARALLGRGFEIDPTVLDLYRVDTQLALLDANYQKALDQINIYLSYVPTNPNGWTLQGEAYLGLNLPADAQAALTRAIELKPGDPRDAYIARGTADLALNDLEAADKDFRQALSLGITTHIRLRIGRAYYNAGVFEPALDQFRRAVTADTTQFDTHYWLGAALVATSEYEEALEELGKALSKADTDLRRFDVYYERAKALDLLDMQPDAVRDLRDALTLNITGRDTQREEARLILSRLGGQPISATQTPTVPAP